MSSSYLGEYPVIDSSGGFFIEQTFPAVQPIFNESFVVVDVTNALQIKYPVRRINTAIGVEKDMNNIETISTSYDLSTNTFANNKVTITAEDILSYITVDDIISMGKLATLYSDFNSTVLKYFGAPQGFSTFFRANPYYDVNGGLFDKNSLLQLLNKFDFNINGTVVTDLSGQFTINDLSTKLAYASANNMFNNRGADKNIEPSDGFFEGDLLYIQNGLTITLKLDIEPEPYTPITNTGPTNLSSISNLINYFDIKNNVSKQTTSTITNITQTYTVPILVSLVNKTVGGTELYGIKWVNKTSTTDIATQNWRTVSVSSTGEFQSAIEEFGDIYTSNDYGHTWVIQYNIGEAITNCISISLTGQYQTATNGKDIYISNDYGTTWNQVFDSGNCQIFVVVRVMGRYQSIISSGDGIYRSTDYGQTWVQHTDVDSDIYNSIQTFPTAGISISHDGKYQIVVCEAIYLSSDYGETWNTTTVVNDVNREYDDHNWVACDISSDGKYAAATEVTGEIYTSQDYGVTWLKNDDVNVRDRQWQDISISSNGKFQTAIEKNGFVFISNDYGITWSISPDVILRFLNWQSISVSSNGLYQTAVVYGGDIYTSEIY
jgi:photosystem II stability/assembly factor-like uncharacterized protein